MNILHRVSPILLAIGLGVIGLYGFALILGAFGPAELPAITAVVVVLGALFGVHAVRVRHQMNERNAPQHHDMMRRLHMLRERRGF